MGMFDLIKLLPDARISLVLVGGLGTALPAYQRVSEELRKIQAGTRA